MASPTVDSNASIAAAGMISPRHLRSRSQSISSDRPSTIGLGLVLPPGTVSPEASYIACSAASQIITNDHDSHADAWYDQNGIEPATETATVSPQALQLVNGFLDQLLLNFLQMSKSTALSALRPAVIEVLKPKLAQDAIHNADEELKEYLGDSAEDEYVQTQGTRLRKDWDLELVWKRTRLRCMVYSSLGDLEEEDEDSYMEAENLEISAHEQLSSAISPAVAIFLTAVIEYMGELTLTVAGQAAYQRVRNKIEKELREGSRDASRPADRILVNEADMERVALDRTLGRLWRGWKKRMRTPTTDIAGRPSPRTPTTLSRQDQALAPGHDFLGIRRPSSSAANSEHDGDHIKSLEHVEPAILEDVQPADIPLPIGENDIEEIEVPGLAHHSDDDDAAEELDEQNKLLKRPKSLTLASYSIFANGLPTPNKSQPHTPVTATRKRSLSLPTPEVPHFYPRTRKLSRVRGSESEASRGNGEAQDNSVEGTDEDLEHLTGPSEQVAGLAEMDRKRQHSKQEHEEPDQAAAFDKAEGMTSSRVSVHGSAPSVDSDLTGKARAAKRSSSIQSARIVDVAAHPRSPAQRSPAHSRPVSSHQSGQAHPNNVAGIAAATGERAGTDAKPVGVKPANVIDLERRPSPARNVATGPEEGAESVQRDAQEATSRSSRTGSPDSAIAASAGESTLISTTLNRKKGPPVRINTKAQIQGHDPAPFSAKSIPLPASPATVPVEEFGGSDVPRKTTGHASRQSPKSDPKSLSSMERTKTHDSDDVGSPLQATPSARQIHTAASSVSSGASRLKPVRTSEEGSKGPDHMARNFEELIQSNQTITYTLTPENMRDLDSKPALDGPVVTKFARRKSEDVRAHGSPKMSPIVAQSAAGRLPSPRLPPNVASPKLAEFKDSSKPAGPVPRAPAGLVVAPSRENGPLAREARVPADTTTSDFAEFIKSTGPQGETAPYAVPKLTSPVSTGKNHRDARRVSTTSSVNRSRYQPRDAVVDSRADNSDLIDFIRQGPPIAASNHRIPRHVAPFRSTMDSDQMSGAIGGKAVDANIPDIRNSQASTNVTDASMPSSINSKSALLRNKNAAVSNKTFDEDDMMPKRKTRRVRDPYAIDFSDEEEDGDEEVEAENVVETPKIPAKKEESLAEFLRNYEPPPQPPALTARTPKRKASAPSLRGRFSRNGKDKDRDSMSIKEPPEPRLPPPRVNGKGYIPIQVNMPPGYDMYGPIEDRNSESRPAVTSVASSASRRVPMKKFEPREPVARRSQTAELASFFRESAPPQNNAPMVIEQTSPRPEEGGGITKMFGRRKKSLAV